MVIQRLGIEDFANYSCLATNNLGKSQEIIELRGERETLRSCSRGGNLIGRQTLLSIHLADELCPEIPKSNICGLPRPSPGQNSDQLFLSRALHVCVFVHVGNPLRPEFDSVVRRVNPESTTWKISWVTKSFANITEYRLLYRIIPVSL